MDYQKPPEIRIIEKRPAIQIAQVSNPWAHIAEMKRRHSVPTADKPTKLASFWNKRATEAFKAENWVEAEKALAKLEEHDKPRYFMLDHEFYMMRAITKVRLKKYKEALVDFKSLLAVDYRTPEVYRALGEAREATGNYQGAYYTWDHLYRKMETSPELKEQARQNAMRNELLWYKQLHADQKRP